jgi:Fuc2NAc and GlcNAc transferase
MELLALGGLTLALSWVLVEQVRAWAVRRQWLDIPCARSAHVRPVPRLGGVPLVVLIAGGMLLGASHGVLPAVAVPLAGFSLLVALVGLVDDLRGLPATPRLAAHLLAAALTVWWTGPLALAGIAGAGLGILAVPLTTLWIAWFINAFNFMDGIDGIAGSLALVAGATWLLLGVAGDTPAWSWAGVLVAAAALGFLRHNWSPARVFMGDAGATCLGYWLATWPLLTNNAWQSAGALLVLWPFVFDATVTLLFRIGAREVLANGHQRHYYQRLVRSGWSHATVSSLYATWSAAMGASVLAARAGVWPATASAVVAAASAMALVALVRWRERLPALAIGQKEAS